MLHTYKKAVTLLLCFVLNFVSSTKEMILEVIMHKNILYVQNAHELYVLCMSMFYEPGNKKYYRLPIYFLCSDGIVMFLLLVSYL